MSNYPTAIPDKRFLLLDTARGLAALAVVFFHRGIHPSFGFPLNVIVQYGEVGAYIFFVISGYVIYQAAERAFPSGVPGATRFARKRFWRVYPPFLASAIFSFAVAVLIQHETFAPADVLGTITFMDLPLGLQSPNGAYWTLFYEVQFYLVMTILILPLFDKWRLLIILFSSVIAALHTLGIWSNHLINISLPNHWFEFQLGILVYLIIQRRLSLKWTLPIFIGLVIIGLGSGYRGQAASIFAVLMFLMYRIDKWLAMQNWMKPLLWLGLVSYSFYLVHLPVFAIHDALLNNILTPGSLLYYCAGILSALFVAGLFFWLFERPFMSSQQSFELAKLDSDLAMTKSE